MTAYFEVESLKCRIYPDEIGRRLSAQQIAKIARRKVYAMDDAGFSYWMESYSTLTEALEEFNSIKAGNRYDENEDGFICTVAVLTCEEDDRDIVIYCNAEPLTAGRLEHERRAVEEKYKALTADA